MAGTTPEGRVKSKVKKVLDPFQPLLWYFMPVPNGYGKQTLDFIGCDRGRYFAIETKAPGEKPTSRQDQTIDDMRAAGARVFVVDGDTTELEAWLCLG